MAGFSGHSSITAPHQLTRFVEEPLTLYGGALESEGALLLYWMKSHRKFLPPFRFDYGTSDALIEENRELHHALDDLNIPHQYFEYEGGHSWDYWREHIAETLIFFDGVCRSLESMT